MALQQIERNQYNILRVILLVSLSTLFLSVQVQAQDAPEITREVSSSFGTKFDGGVELGEGSVISLEIQAQGSSPLSYIWSLNGSTLRTTTSRYLTIPNANVTLSGSYRCKVENVYGSALSLSYRINVKVLGEFESVTPETVSEAEGNFTVLDLPPISHVTGAFRFQWVVNGSPISDNGNYYETLSKDLAVLNIPSSFNGNSYKAEIVHISSQGLRRFESHVFNLAVSASTSLSLLQTFVIRPKDTEVVSNQNSEARFECLINGRLSNIDWYRLASDQSRSMLQSNNKYTVSSTKRRLTITNVNLSDAGDYECEGIGDGGTKITDSASLTVHEKPTIQSSSVRRLTKDFQENFVQDCQASGTPSPQITWFINGTNINNQSSNGLVIFPNGTLSIPSVDLPDSGVYQCFVTNVAGEAASYTQLIVNSAKPELIKRPRDKTVIEHEDTELTCQVHGGPQPQVFWTKDGENLTIGGRIRKTRDDLLIGAVEMSDAGLYTCHAVNLKGSISANATITVVVKTRITRPPQNISRIVSTDARLECGVRSDPSVNVTWTWFFSKDLNVEGQEIQPEAGNRNILRDGTLVISGVVGSDSGKYVCKVSSDGGNDQRTATLSVTDLPSKPSIDSVKLNEIQANSVQIDWTLSYNGDTPITKFVIQIQEDTSLSGANIDNPWESKINNVDPSLRSLVVGDLLPARYYRFRIKAINVVGESAPSDPAPVNEPLQMPSQPPGEPPKDLFCSQGKEREIKVQWEPPPESTWNGELEGYIVFFKIEGLPENTEKEKKVLGKDKREVTLTGLAFYKKYRVQVAAFNDKGAGIKSPEFYVITLQGKPSQPPRDVELISINSTSVEAKWLPPPYRELNGLNMGYNIEIWTGGVLDRVDTMRFDEKNPTGIQSFEIANLNQFTDYEISIACRTVRGAGPYSPKKPIKTLQDIPGPVTGLRVDNIRDNSLRVNWREPLKINGILTGYVITYQVKDDASDSRQVERKPTATDTTLRDLRYETTYIITVQAKTVIGPGPPSTTEIDSGVPPELPGPASNLAVSNIDSRSVLLQFIQGDNGKTSILLWIIEAQIEDSTEWTRIFTKNDPDAFKITVQNLRPYTRYRLRIVKKNIVDLSEPSEPSEPFQTLQDVPGIPPADVTPRATSPTSIRIRWRQIPRNEWNGDFVGYKIFYRRWSLDVDLNSTTPSELRKVRNSTWTNVTLRNGNNLQEHSITDLEEWMDYEIYMVSYNAAGNSQPSSSLFERTNEALPSGYPMDLEPVDTSSTSIKMTWMPVPVLSRNGRILGYKVKYTAKLVNSEPQYVQVNDADTLNVTLNGLRKFVEYDIQILAFNRIGDGILSPVSNIRTAGDVPGPPVIIYFPNVNETSATIQWQAPDEPNGYIIRYRVSYRRLDQPDSVLNDNFITKSKTVFEHTTTGLSGETYYLFTVEARTEDGWGEPARVKVYTFSSRARPNPPTNVRIDGNLILSRSMSIDWSPGDDNYGPVRNFTVQYKLGSGDWATVDKTIGPDATSYTVTGLKPNMQYSFRVAATNDIGRSDFSVQSTTKLTDSDVPGGSPQNVNITALSTSSLLISWTEPLKDSWNSEYLMGYRIRYKLDGNPSLPWDHKITEGTEVTVTGLDKGEKYVCSVQATNYKGGGPWSSAITAYMEIAPQSSPMDVRMMNKSSTQIEISWNPPPPTSTNGELTGYKVTLWKPTTDSCQDIANRDAQIFTRSPASFDKLKPYTYYCSTVQALNIAGDGPKNTPLGIHTSEDYPGAPASMLFANISLESLVVTWEAPLAANGIITHYQLEYFVSLKDGITDRSSRRIPGENREWNITELIKEQNYTFSMAAYNSIGKGNVIERKVYIGPQKGSPERPIQLKASLREKIIYLTWVNQGEGMSPIYGYEIRAEEEGKKNEWILVQKKESPESSTTINLSSLKWDKNYLFRVRAVNSHGISQPSPSSELTRIPKSLATAKSSVPFHEEWWFLVIVALSSVIFILLLITLLCFAEKRRNAEKMKRSTTNTTVMSEIQESEDGGFPSLQLRQSRRSLGRAPKPQNNIYAISPPRPSPASITYSDDTPPPPILGAIGGAMKAPISEDTSSELSEKPSHLGDSSDDSSDDSDDSSTNSIAKAPIPASPPPPAFSSHVNKGYTPSNGGAGARKNLDSKDNPSSWRFQNTNNAYTYTDSEAESSHYAFSLNNGNIVVNNVAGARTPLSGFSSFV